MKEWFPFTDYDFYGYLAAGLPVLFALDYSLTGGTLLITGTPTFMQGVLTVALAYIVGQIIAIPSSIIIEMCFARKILRPPAAVLLSDKAGWLDWLISTIFVGRYYAPLSENTRNKIFNLAQREEGLTQAQITTNPDVIFDAAYRHARKNEDARKRMDDFRNQYGFARNTTVSFLVAAILLFTRGATDETALIVAWTAIILSMGMLVRFIKFYSCFAGEMLKAYAYKE